MLLIINLGNWLFSDGNIFYSHQKNYRKLEQFELEHVVDFQAFQMEILRVVQTQAILFFKSMSERVGSDIERL